MIVRLASFVKNWNLDALLRVFSGLALACLILLIAYLFLSALLQFFKNRNRNLFEPEERVVAGQIGTVMQTILPDRPGKIVCDTGEMKIVITATSTVELESGTVIVVLDCEADHCKVRPLVRRVGSCSVS